MKKSMFECVRKGAAVTLAGLFTCSTLFGVVGLPCSTSMVYAGQMLGQTDFDDGSGLPWHIVESGPGKMEFAIEDGVYKVTIVNPGGRSRGGEDRWDCQFRHRGLKIVSGHQYKVEYEITASNSGKYYTKIGNLEGNIEVWHNMSNGNDLGNTWDPIPIAANETKKVSLTFTANQSLDVAEWAFHLGGDGQYTNGDCFPAGTVITFDNMSLIDMTSDENDYVHEEPWVRSGILTNQLGYLTETSKKATLLSDSKSPVKFSLLDESGKSVYDGKSTVIGYDEDSGDNVHVLDFSDYKKEGTYSLKADDCTSRKFKIGIAKDYSALLYDSLNYFYQNRSGIEIKSEYITSGDTKALARKAGHASDVAQIMSDFNGTKSGKTQDVTGGWYDAGDHGKYVVNGGISLWLMQNQYEMALYTGSESAYADKTMNIPENNNGYPDLLDEARYEMEWMLKMIVLDGPYKDMVYHKVHDIKWTGLGLAPADDDQERIIMPPTTAATLNLAACAAQSYRLWKDLDKTYADKCLDAAKAAYKAASANPKMFAPLEESGGGGAYGDDKVVDEFYWAACELYLATGDKQYLNDMKDNDYYLKIDTVLKGGESVDGYASFDWGHTATLGNLSLLLNEPSGVKMEELKANLKDVADDFLKTEDKQGYGQPLKAGTISYKDDDKGYIWGSNSLVVDNAIVLAYQYVMSQDEKYYNGVVSALDYILGRNPMDYSYVTGYGTHAVKYPHHRYWSNLIDSAFPLAPSGVMSGGPNSGMEDPWVRGSGWKKGTIAPAKCFLDHIEAWSVNECTINWNAPLAYAVGFVTAFDKEGITIGSTYEAPVQTKTNDSAKVDEVDNSEKKPDEKVDVQDTKNGSDSKKDSKDNTKLYIIIAILVTIIVIVISLEIFFYKMYSKMHPTSKQE